MYLEGAVVGVERVAVVGGQHVFTFALELVGAAVERDVVRVSVRRAARRAREVCALQLALLTRAETGTGCQEQEVAPVKEIAMRKIRFGRPKGKPCLLFHKTIIMDIANNTSKTSYSHNKKINITD